MLEELRQEVCRANMALPENGLVTWTSGNVSGRDPETGLVVIKPSGLLFEDLTPENMVIVDLEGQVIEAEHGPSTDTASHLYLYRHRHEVMVEDVARTVWLAMQIGQIEELPPEEIAANYDRYQHRYATFAASTGIVTKD